jgi:hypothetical protein
MLDTENKGPVITVPDNGKPVVSSAPTPVKAGRTSTWTGDSKP